MVAQSAHGVDQDPTLSPASHPADAVIETVTTTIAGGGEVRLGQRQMARIVHDAIGRPSAVCIEAGTGTGKSVAYLAPLINAKKKTVVATATIALQGQLVNHDVPMMARALNRQITVATLKGRGNYLCQQRVDELERSTANEQLDLLGASGQDGLDELLEWAQHTETGDREDLPALPHYQLWQAVSVGPDECPGAARCPRGDTCFSERARAAAHEADVIITNHHYYGLNIALDNTLVPEHDVVVFDEAHHLPEVIAATCGTEVSPARLRGFARQTARIMTDQRTVSLLDDSAHALDRWLRSRVGTGVELDEELIAVLVAARDRVERVVNALRRLKPTAGTDAAARVERLRVAATAVIDSIDAAMERDGDVLWVDGTDANPVLRRTPVQVGGILRSRLWGERTVVLTSATLPDGIIRQLGVPESTTVDRVGSAFAYEDLGWLYCAKHLPAPRHPQARAAIADELAALITAAGGRTLALFTSASAMNEAATTLRDRLDVPILMQGEGSKAALIEAFRADPATCLFATLSFWQGVDLPGDTLTLVTIDRIPFPRPDDPVLQARRTDAGPHAFRVIDLPRAQILLAQAAGRLIRRADDRGVVAVLDSRLATAKSYRWELINAQPPRRRSSDPDHIMDILASLTAESTPSGI